MPLYTWTAVAPRRIFSAASLPFMMPPTPIIGSLPSMCSANIFSTWLLFSRTGRPLKPPCSFASGWLPRLDLSMVVLVAMMPSISTDLTTWAMSSICASSKSGAILTASGTYFPCAAASCACLFFRASSSALSSSPPCSARRFLVLGEEILTVM